MNKIIDVVQMLKDLRKPKTGCAWTASQTFESLIPHTHEEVYELVDAIETQDTKGIQDELSDLLYHVLFYAEIAEENALFSLDDIAQSILDKHQRRMPSPSDRVNYSADEIDHYWEQYKREERKQKQLHSVLDGIAGGLPAMLHALKLQKRAAKVGFDWPSYKEVFDKIREEIAELEEALAASSLPEGEGTIKDIPSPSGRGLGRGASQHVQEEIGDLLFCLVNLARKLDIHPETALRECNRKFTQRFHAIEAALANKHQAVETTPLSELEALWQEAKLTEIVK
jgi:ATP diphosphatase